MSIYYVSKTGSDSNPGTLSAPWLTINHISGHIVPGDTVQVRAGTYQEQINITTSGTASNRITITNYPGESPVIDGAYKIPSAWTSFLVSVSGNYVTFSGFSITRSKGAGLISMGNYDILLNDVVNGAYEVGICGGGTSFGDHNTVDGCTATQSGIGYGINGQDSWGAGIVIQGHYDTIQNCLSYENRGEGLNGYQSYYAIIQDSVSYDNQSCLLYLDSASNLTARRNLVYLTKPQYGGDGILIGAEVRQPSDYLICNNLVMGCRTNFEVDSNVSSLKNMTVVYNTFVNSSGDANVGYNMGVLYRPDVSIYSGSVFTNNIVVEEVSGRVPISIASSHPGLVCSYNLWNKTPVTGAKGGGDITANPLLAKTGSTAAGQLTSAWFKIAATSPAKDKAKVIAEVPDDFFRTQRGSAPDMGAYEIPGAAPVPLSVTASGSPLSGTVPLAVTFTSSATGGVTPYTFAWTFGDGQASNLQSPAHTYSVAGTYSVSLTVTDSAGTAVSQAFAISVAAVPALVVSAAASATISVAFTDNVSGGVAPYSFSWAFGDGSVSAIQNPTHTYVPGTYVAVFTATDSKGTSVNRSISLNLGATVA
jgi:PKD repeat protein